MQERLLKTRRRLKKKINKHSCVITSGKFLRKKIADTCAIIRALNPSSSQYVPNPSSSQYVPDRARSSHPYKRALRERHSLYQHNTRAEATPVRWILYMFARS